MNGTPTFADGWGAAPSHETRGAGVTAWLLRVVDAGLLGIILVAPYFFGGRHDLGRLVLVSLIAVTAGAWFLRQALLPAAAWPRTVGHLILALAAGMLVLQIVPLPEAWLERVSPTTGELLPLWRSAADDAARLGTWQTLSLTPHKTTKSLALLVGYALLFIVVSGRIQTAADIQRLLRWIALSAVAMAGFAIVHYFTTDGRYFWFFDHPHRVARNALSGPFINRNHFASFLVLAIGPLAALLLLSIEKRQSAAVSHRFRATIQQRLAPWIMGAALALIMATTLATGSRGGSAALLVAGGFLAILYMRRGLVDGRAVYGFLALVVVVVGFLSVHGYDQMVRRLDDFAEGSLDDIDHNGIRRKLWAANVAAFQAHPVLGTGAGSHRDVYPAYLPESFNKVYTHAENGYLQIASETGAVGVVLLVAAIGCCAGWCASCLRHAEQPQDVRLFGAAAAGLAASLVHSGVDFVWYIPACTSITLVLAACVFRHSQLLRAAVGQAVPDTRSMPKESAARKRQAQPDLLLPRGRWLELTAAAMLLGGWSVYMYVGPAIAAIHWNRYLRASVAGSKVSRQQINELVSNKAAPNVADRATLNDLMIGHLQQVVRWDPRFAQAHLRLAAKYLLKFEIAQTQAENAMSLIQIRDTAQTANFASPAELQAWLHRAFGENVKWLQLAAAEARAAVALSPLDGAGYVYLADLAFLNAMAPIVAESLVDQALRVRPYHADVRYVVGEHAWRKAELEAAMDHWSQCFRHTGPHQMRIVFWLAGRIPVEELLERLQSDWTTLRQIWARYREMGQPQDLETLLAYSIEMTRRETAERAAPSAAQIWHWQSAFYEQLGRSDEALACLERAYACDPNNYAIRLALARALPAAERYAEAESHVRWCLARRPADKSLTSALVKISKARLAQHSSPRPSSNAPAAVPTRQ